jgi:hypothetical protein
VLASTRNWRAFLLPEAALKALLHKPGLTRLDKTLLCLAVDADKAKAVSEVKRIGQAAGLRAMKKWNVSSILARSKGLAIRTAGGWELSPDGRLHVATLAGHLAKGPAARVSACLRSHLATIADPDTRSFVEEAVTCHEMGLHRAAVVLSWVGAVSVLREYVVQNKLADFNAEARRRDPKWRTAKTGDDLGRMTEYDFLQVLEGISVIGNSVKQELEKRLQLRNGCGHPSSLKIAENMVAAHIEALILNVFSQFSI